MVLCGVSCELDDYTFTKTSILPGVRSSIHPFLQIILDLVLNLQCDMELNQFRPPTSSNDLCFFSYLIILLWLDVKRHVLCVLCGYLTAVNCLCAELTWEPWRWRVSWGRPPPAAPSSMLAVTRVGPTSSMLSAHRPSLLAARPASPLTTASM